MPQLLNLHPLKAGWTYHGGALLAPVGGSYARFRLGLWRRLGV